MFDRFQDICVGMFLGFLGIVIMLLTIASSIIALREVGLKISIDVAKVPPGLLITGAITVMLLFGYAASRDHE